MPEPMNDNARIVREALESARPLLEHGFQEIHADIYSPALQQLYDSFDALTALETELATAQADMERARKRVEQVISYPPEGHRRRTEEGYPMECVYDRFAYERMVDSYRDALRAALAPEQKGE